MAGYPGSFKSRAAAAGKDPAAFAEANIHADGVVGKLARLYYIQQGVHGNGKTNMGQAGDARTTGDRIYQIG